VIVMSVTINVQLVLGPNRPRNLNPQDAIEDYRTFLTAMRNTARAKFVTSKAVNEDPAYPLPQWGTAQDDTAAAAIGQTLAICATASKTPKVMQTQSLKSWCQALYLVTLLASGTSLDLSQLRNLMAACDASVMDLFNTLFPPTKSHRWEFGNLAQLKSIYDELSLMWQEAVPVRVQVNPFA